MKKVDYSESVRMAMETLRAHKMRSFLTVLGVIIGVLTVIVIASILTGMRSNIVAMIEEFGTSNIYAFHLNLGVQTGPIDREEWQRDPLTVEDAEALRRNADAIEEVAYAGFSIFSSSNIKYEGRDFTQVNLQGVSPSLAEVSNISLEQGRFVTEADNLRRNEVAVLGINVVEALFPNYEQIAGREVIINGRQFTVVGTLEKRKNTFFGQTDEDNVVYIPFTTLRKLAPRSDDLMILVRAKPNRLEEAYDEVEATLRLRRGLRFDEENNFSLTTAEGFIEQFDAVTASIGLVAIAISGVGLLVGGIGVMNIMLVSVTERTREIGLRKAIGAKRKDIILQFLFEAITLSTAGGLLGILLAVGVSYFIIWLIPQLPAIIPLWAVVTGFLVSLAVGLIFGVWPAVKASRLDPIESLRYE